MPYSSQNSARDEPTSVRSVCFLGWSRHAHNLEMKLDHLLKGKRKTEFDLVKIQENT